MGCQRFDLISYDLIFNVMSRSLLTGSSMKICDLLGSTCPVTAVASYVFTARLEAQRCQVTPYVVNFQEVVGGGTDSYFSFCC